MICPGGWPAAGRQVITRPVLTTTSLPHRRGYQGPPSPHRRRRLHHAHHGHRLLPHPAPHSGRATPMWQGDVVTGDRGGWLAGSPGLLRRPGPGNGS